MYNICIIVTRIYSLIDPDLSTPLYLLVMFLRNICYLNLYYPQLPFKPQPPQYQCYSFPTD